jgi:membrane-bound metal-dependent hydrolase YbcI (DUF457 family)
MPSPFVHLTIGTVLARQIGRHRPATRSLHWRLWLTCLFFSMAPDLDAVLGVITGDMAGYHNQISHSLFFGLLLCALLTPVCMVFLRWAQAGRVFLLIYGSYALHLALDWLTYGRGLMLFWPITERRFISPLQPFIGVRWSEGVFHHGHLFTLANEAAVLALGALLYLLIRQLRRPPA